MPRICFIAAMLACTHLSAAPPKVEWLYPAGAGRGTTTTIAANDGGAWPVQIWIDEPAGITIESHKDKGKLTVTTTVDAMPGVRWVRLFNDDGASTLRPLIVGTLPEMEEKEPNNAQPQEVTLPMVINGRLSKNGEVDSFRIKLRKGQTLVASMTANGILASPMDAVIQVCDGDGFVLIQNDDGRGLDPQVAYQVVRDGDYIVRTFAFPATPGSSINYAGGIDYIYRLSLTTDGFINHTLPLAVAHDKDTVVNVIGWNIPSDAMKVTLPPAGDRDVVTLFHPQLGNTLELPVTQAALVIAADDNTAAKPQAVTVPANITGSLAAPRSQHAYRFSARKGQKLRLQLESQSLGYPLDAVIRVTDATGKELSETDDSNKLRDPSLSFTPPADGDYIATVRDLHDRGGLRFVYRLSMEPVTPDFAATLAADVFTTAPGKPLEIAVTIDRRDGFDGEISVSIEGLPEGCAAPAVISKPKDASAKEVKLTLTATDGPWSGPIRIIATAADKRRLATFATVGEARHHQAWLTITKPASKPGKANESK